MASSPESPLRAAGLSQRLRRWFGAPAVAADEPDDAALHALARVSNPLHRFMNDGLTGWKRRKCCGRQANGVHSAERQSSRRAADS